MNKECDCKHSGIRIVRGNDVTIEAVVSVFDKATGTYSPIDLSEVEGVSLNMVGPFVWWVIRFNRKGEGGKG